MNETEALTRNLNPSFRHYFQSIKIVFNQKSDTNRVVAYNWFVYNYAPIDALGKFFINCVHVAASIKTVCN